ncbi:hypothetical protein EDD86DRAFT_188729 [Gorgonomyces haynaldii]|nr:hypothetical protein EDD86DRAFT_188729 [Gorgonomyces haynaldii]
MHFSKSYRYLLINAMDRTARSYVVYPDKLELLCKYVDAVDRLQWVQCQFSADEEYVATATTEAQKHKIYMWELKQGNLVRVLEGPQEGFMDMRWHPNQPSFSSLNHFGTLFIWKINYIQNFSAFAPSFIEIDDNKEYIEKEDEFDVERTQNEIERISKPLEDMGDVQIDIIATDFYVNNISDTDDDEGPFFVPLKM